MGCSMPEETLMPETRLFKDREGKWIAESIVPIGESRELQVRTYRRGANVCTTAAVHTVGDCYRMHVLHQDYSKMIYIMCGRGTEKFVHKVHTEALKHQLQDVLKAVQEQYNLRGGEDAKA